MAKGEIRPGDFAIVCHESKARQELKLRDELPVSGYRSRAAFYFGAFSSDTGGRFTLLVAKRGLESRPHRRIGEGSLVAYQA